MQTTLPDLPFNARCIITADTHSTSHNASDNAAPPGPTTDLKHFKPWTTFTTEIHTIICDAMTSKCITNGTNIIVGETFRRPRVVACEGDVHEVANTELHQAVVDVLSELGVEGRFWRPGSGGVGIVGEGDFAWLGSGDGALTHAYDGDPKLVVEYTPDWIADLLDLDASLDAIARGKFTVNDRQCVDALHQIYGYMTFNDHKYGILSNLHRTWFFERAAESGGTLNYAGPIDLTGATSPGSGPSILKAFVGVVLLAEKNPFHASPVVDPVRLFASTDMDGYTNYLPPTKDGAYKCLDLDPCLCHFRRCTVRHIMRGFVVEANLPNRNVTAICKIVDLFQNNQTAITALETESKVYLALRHLQGLCIPKVYGFFSIWGILRLLALENVGEAISESEPISSALRGKMKAAVGRIHKEGYVHGDIERRNFCTGTGGSVFVVDLEYCEKTRDRMRMDDEMDAIDAL